MITAAEASALAKKYDIFAGELEAISEDISKCAKQGCHSTWWYCENLDKSQQKALAKRLEDFGYVTSVGLDAIYINWRDK